MRAYMVIMIIMVLAIVVLKSKVYLKLSNGNTQTDELHNFLVLQLLCLYDSI
jgi:hypothetical protein